MKKLLLIFALITTPCTADTVFKYGSNAAKEGESLGSTKSIFIANQNQWFGPFSDQYEVGVWFDNTGIKGRKSSGLLGYSLGVNVNSGYLFGQAFIGPSLISHTDSNLGGHFQFNNDIAFGLRDPESQSTIGINYKHVSSAGLELPNKGRDFLMFRVGISW